MSIQYVVAGHCHRPWILGKHIINEGGKYIIILIIIIIIDKHNINSKKNYGQALEEKH
jgi:hypothetical protein